MTVFSDSPLPPHHKLDRIHHERLQRDMVRVGYFRDEAVRTRHLDGARALWVLPPAILSGFPTHGLTYRSTLAAGVQTVTLQMAQRAVAGAKQLMAELIVPMQAKK